MTVKVRPLSQRLNAFALGPSASFFASGSSLGPGGWYGLSVLLSSDMGRTALNGLDVNTDAGFV